MRIMRACGISRNGKYFVAYCGINRDEDRALIGRTLRETNKIAYAPAYAGIVEIHPIPEHWVWGIPGEQATPEAWAAYAASVRSNYALRID